MKILTINSYFQRHINLIALVTILFFSQFSHANQINLTAQQFILQLEQPQKKLATFNFNDSERFHWQYIPTDRKGISLKQLNQQQQHTAHQLLKLSLSEQGYQKVIDVMSLEDVLLMLTGKSFRDSSLYFISIFGTPSEHGNWGWRFEGHHLSLNFTIIDGKLTATAPNFWGANPAIVPSGPKKGFRLLQKEEDMARALLLSLSTEQQQTAIIAKQAYRDILSKNKVKMSALNPKGISFNELTNKQQRQLLAIIEHYLASMPKDVAKQRRAQIQVNSLHKIHFAWAGEKVPNKKHYYRIQGESFLIEYDNVHKAGNHIHTVWRDFNGDFGLDILAKHQQLSH